MFIVNWQAGTEWWQDVAPTMMTHRHTVTHLCYARLCPALTSLSAHTARQALKHRDKKHIGVLRGAGGTKPPSFNLFFCSESEFASEVGMSNKIHTETHTQG